MEIRSCADACENVPTAKRDGHGEEQNVQGQASVRADSHGRTLIEYCEVSTLRRGSHCSRASRRHVEALYLTAEAIWVGL